MFVCEAVVLGISFYMNLFDDCCIPYIIERDF